MLIHKHPLENQSLAPLNLRTKLSYDRLQYKSDAHFWVFEERMMARFWEKCNRLNAPGPLPIAEIIHTILPAMTRVNRISRGDFVFDGALYLTRDIVTLSSTVQWFGTNVGRCFVDEPLQNPGGRYHPSREFIIKLQRSNRDRDMYAFLSHRCAGRCLDPRRKRFRLGFSDPCVYDSRQVTDRDRAVIDGLMRWLGTARGRQYLVDYRARRSAARAEVDRRRRAYFERRRAA